MRRRPESPTPSRRLAVAFLGTAVAVALAPAAVRAGTYAVIQCDPSYTRSVSGSHLDIDPPYAFQSRCADRGPLSLTVQRLAARGDRARFGWVAPPGTELVHVFGETSLDNDKGHKARLYVADAHGSAAPQLAGGGRHTRWHSFRWSGAGREGLYMLLACDPSGTGPCGFSTEAHAKVRHVHLQLADASPPTAAASNTLVAPGWRAGSQTLIVHGTDYLGSGVRGFEVTANGAPVAPSQAFNCPGLIPGTAFASIMQPCKSDLQREATLSTKAAPFHDGANTLAACVFDYAGQGAPNRTCDTRTVMIDNSPPRGAFQDAQDPDDPDLIAAPVSDPYSGVASGQISYRPVGTTVWQPLATQLNGGELQARVDSQYKSPGRYEFEVQATDRVGNGVTTAKREDGTDEVLEFPLKAQTEVDAFLPGGRRKLSVRYGTSERIHGRLVTRDGQPVAGQPVVVTEYFGIGALISERVRTVMTGLRGRWHSKIPAGPSRSITVAYTGSSKYGDSAERGLHYAVRSKATLRTSRRRVRGGHRIAFRGRVAHFAARIPDGGKVIELQVRDRAARGGWNTIGQAFGTNQRGRYRVHYRFANFYSHRVTYRFRVKVTREEGWPYGTPAHSHSRKVTVVPRRR
jgi:hypothetical protein